MVWSLQSVVDGQAGTFDYGSRIYGFQMFVRFCVDMEIIEDFDKERFGEYLGELRTGRD